MGKIKNSLEITSLERFGFIGHKRNEIYVSNNVYGITRSQGRVIKNKLVIICLERMVKHVGIIWKVSNNRSGIKPFREDKVKNGLEITRLERIGMDWKLKNRYTYLKQNFQSRVRNTQLVSNNRLNESNHRLETKNQFERIGSKTAASWNGRITQKWGILTISTHDRIRHTTR